MQVRAGDLAKTIADKVRTQVGAAWRSGQRWGALVTALGLVLLTVVYAANPRPQKPESDGIYNWDFARSLVFDRDLNFTNDYTLCGDPWTMRIRQHTPGRPDNPYYIGPSLLWAPLLAVARLVVKVPPGASAAAQAGCWEPHTTFVFFFAGPMLGAFVLWLCYRAARRFAGDGAAAVAAALVTLGGSLAAYAAELPWIGHLQSAAAAALLVLAALRAWEEPERVGRWVAVAAALMVVVIERPTDSLLGVLPATVALVKLWRRWPRLFLAGGMMAVAFVLGQLPSMLVSRYLNGTFTASTVSANFMHFNQAHPFLVLFAAHGGLFYYTPAAWAAVPGVVLAWREQRPWRPVIAALGAALVLAIYINSVTLDWHGHGTYGARRLLFMTPALAMFAAGLTEWAARLLARRPGAALALASAGLLWPVVSTNLSQVIAQGNAQVRIDSASNQGELYGGASKLIWSWIDDKVGPLAVLPASLVFRFRYKLPPSSYYGATDTYWYKRNHMTLAWYGRDVPLHQPYASGATVTGGHMQLGDGRATYVFSAQWPVATHLRVRARAPRPVNLRVGSGGWFGTTWYGTVKVTPTEETFELAIPKGGFSSGIVELVFEPDGPGVEIKAMALDDRSEHSKPWSALASPAPALALAP